MFDICIIGAGAAGMLAAIAAGRENPERSVCILEKKEEPGKKLLASGNGRCNITNRNCTGAQEVLEFFKTLGIYTRTEEEGRVYPYSERASDVVKALLLALYKQNTRILTGRIADSAEWIEGAFLISCSGGERISAKKLLLATGGKAGPQYGSSGDGYRIARAFGHRITRVAPVLAAVECVGDFSKLKGVRAKGTAALCKAGRMIAAEEGEIQFTEYGLSGICMFNLSRQIRLADDLAVGFKAYSICIDFFPELSGQETEAMLLERFIAGMREETLLLSMVHEKLAKDIIERTEKRLSQLRKEEKSCLLKWESAKQFCAAAALELKAWEVQVSGVAGWRDAQCTRGGIPVSELWEETMESRLVNGLYFAGEIIDYDGPCGGYNLQNAWETGIKAGKSMAAGED